MREKEIASIVGAPYATAEAVVIGAPFEGTASGRTGMKHGPAAVKRILDGHIELYDRFLNTEPALNHAFGFAMADEITGKTPEEMVALLEERLEKETRPFVLVGGEHSVSIPAFRALAKRADPKEVTIVQIDAHLDYRHDDSEYNEEPSLFAQSAVMRRGHELGFNTVSVGIRTINDDEAHYVAAHQNITVFEWGREHMIGEDHCPLPSVEYVLRAIPTKLVYLTLDIDGIDPSEMPGTGTPVGGGMSYAYANALVRALIQEKALVGVDVVEVAANDHGDPDYYEITEYNAGQLIYEMLALMVR